MKNMKALIFLLFILVLVFGLYGEENDPRIRALEQRLTVIRFEQGQALASGDTAPLSDRLLFYKIPGLGISFIDDAGSSWNRGYGVLKAGEATPVTHESIFQAGSVSKMVTAVILLHFVEKGLFDLDTDVNRYLKSWQMPQTEFTKERKISLRHLLTHQSGLPGTDFNRDTEKPMPSLVQVLNGEKPAQNKPARPQFKPGEKWSYSNLGYVVIQLVLEDTFGKGLDQIAREYLFAPLGMKSSTFQYPLPEEWRFREALPHDDARQPRDAVQDSPARAQGGLMTTTEDMALLIRDLMDAWSGGKGKILRSTMVRQMMQPYAQVPKEAMGLDLEMGLGVFLMKSHGKIVFMHPGYSYPGSVFMVLAIPEIRQGVVMAPNGKQGDLLKTEILATLADLYQWPIADFFKKKG